MKSTIIKTGFIALMILSLTGCFGTLGSKPDDTIAEEPQFFYVIDVDRGLKEHDKSKGKVLYLAPVKVTSQFAAKNLVFKVGNNAFQPQPDHEFFDTPEEMFTTQLQRWLQKTGLFHAVILDNTQAADLTLDTAVTGLYGVKMADYRPQAIIEMQFFMTDNHATTDEVIFQTGLQIDIDIAETTPANVVTGWKIGFKKLLSTLEDDLSGYFSDTTP